MIYHSRSGSRSPSARAPERRDARRLAPTPLRSASAFIANFFDTLGIGSFATTTSMSKLWNVMPDEKIPGTLNVGYVMADGRAGA